MFAHKNTISYQGQKNLRMRMSVYFLNRPSEQWAFVFWITGCRTNGLSVQWDIYLCFWKMGHQNNRQSPCVQPGTHNKHQLLLWNKSKPAKHYTKKRRRLHKCYTIISTIFFWKTEISDVNLKQTLLRTFEKRSSLQFFFQHLEMTQ